MFEKLVNITGHYRKVNQYNFSALAFFFFNLQNNC